MTMHAEIGRGALFGKLNPLLFKSIESATVFCKLRGNPYVELAHWLHQLLNEQDSDLHRILRHFEVDSARLAADLTQALERLPRGANTIQDLSDHIEHAVERAWVHATLQFGEGQVRSAYLLIGILKTRGLANVLFSISKEFEGIAVDTLCRELAGIVKNSPEHGQSASDGFALSTNPGENAGALAGSVPGAHEALKRFTVDLTERARSGELDPVTGRDEEIRQVVDVLMRRRQNNPLLAGEAGVGKTAIAEGLALRIAQGDVPPPLKDVALLTLDVGLLQAGASMKGEFENRLRQVIDEVQASPHPIVLFIDEVHTLVGAGGAAGTGDAANLLKPALARGTLRTIGATTWAEYKKYIEKDPALTRRFQVVQVAEPDEAKAIAMLRRVAPMLQAHHHVRIDDSAIAAAVSLSHRYIPARQLPDKAVSLLDTACARVAIGQHAMPAAVEDATRRIEVLVCEQDLLQRESALGTDHVKRLADLDQDLAHTHAELARLRARWHEEGALVAQIIALEAGFEQPTAAKPGTQTVPDATAYAGFGNPTSTAPGLGAPGIAAPGITAAVTHANPQTGTAGSAANIDDRRQQLAELRAQLETLQGDSPLVCPTVAEAAVASVVADWTGIPVGRMVRNEIQAVLRLADTLEQRVIGQRHALETIARRIKTSRARLDDPKKPIGVFMLVGPSGVGKTETALALAESLYGGEQNLIAINMSEFQEAHTVSTLKGAPPGYVGYGEGGVLTEAVRRRPYSVVLLDEIEKAHPDVHELFFQVFDKGWMEDGEGRFIDFKNTVILLTSNVGSELITSLCADPALMPEPDTLARAIREPLLAKFPAAFLGRLVPVAYLPLSDTMLQRIIRLQLDRVVERISERHGARLEHDDAFVQWVAGRCTEVESGGRMVDAILTHTLLPALSEEFLTRLVQGRTVQSIRLGVKDNAMAIEFDQ